MISVRKRGKTRHWSRVLTSDGGGSEVKFDRNAETPVRDDTSETLVEGARVDLLVQYIF